MKTSKFIQNLLPFSVVDKLQPPPHLINKLIVNDQWKGKYEGKDVPAHAMKAHGKVGE
jgi:hypothetical protein